MTIHFGGGGSFPPASAVVATCSWHALSAVINCIGQLIRASPDNFHCLYWELGGDVCPAVEKLFFIAGYCGYHDNRTAAQFERHSLKAVWNRWYRSLMGSLPLLMFTSFWACAGFYFCVSEMFIKINTEKKLVLNIQQFQNSFHNAFQCIELWTGINYMMTVKQLKECGAKFCVEPPRTQQRAFAPGWGGGGRGLGAKRLLWSHPISKLLHFRGELEVRYGCCPGCRLAKQNVYGAVR